MPAAKATSSHGQATRETQLSSSPGTDHVALMTMPNATPATSTATVRFMPPQPREAMSGSCGDLGRRVEQREPHVEHLVQRADGHALVGLVVALGSVGEVRAREAHRLERIAVRGPPGGDVNRLVAHGAQGGL